jgi:hypothetical protein
MKTYAVKIEGIQPLRPERFTSYSKITGKKMTEEMEIKEAEERLYKNDQGDYIIPRHVIFANLREGARSVKVARKSLFDDIVQSVAVPQDAVIVYGKDDPRLVTLLVKIPPVKGTYTEKKFYIFQEWKAEFVVEVYDDYLDKDLIHKCLIKAGMLGYMGGRKKEQWGRYIVLQVAEK